MHRHCEDRACEHDHSGNDANLPFKRDRFLSANYGQAGRDPSLRSTFDVTDVQASSSKSFATLLTASSRLAYEIQWLRAGAILKGLRRQLVKRDITRKLDVDLPKFRGRPHIDQVYAFAAFPQTIQLFWRNRRYHANLRYVEMS
jgi:hypothetical protein